MLCFVFPEVAIITCILVTVNSKMKTLRFQDFNKINCSRLTLAELHAIKLAKTWMTELLKKNRAITKDKFIKVTY